MKTWRIVLSTIIFLNLIGCATTKPKGPTMREVCEGYVGKHYNEVVQEWGDCNGEKDDGQGGRVLTWVDIIQPTRYTSFRVGPNGIIYKWQSTQKTKADIEIENNKNKRPANTAIILGGLILIGIGIWWWNSPIY